MGLQFGHGTDAVEDTRVMCSSAGTSRELQFGHGTDAVEDAKMLPPGAGLQDPLQCAHGTDAVEDCGHVRMGRRGGTRFNSATALTPWRTPVLARVLRPVERASIRPRH